MAHKHRLAWLGATLVAAGALLLGSGQAALAAVGAPVYSPEQAGYSVTGAKITSIQGTLALPVTSGFTQVSGLGISVQMWNASEVFVFGLSDCAGSSCTSNYSPAVAVYDIATRGLVCSTANGSCPGTPASWLSGAANIFAQGDTTTVSAHYNLSTGAIVFQASDRSNGLGADYRYPGTTGLIFNQVRIGAEFGCSPWDATLCGGHYTSAGPQPLASFSGVGLRTYAGKTGGLTSFGTAHKVIMTSGGTSTGTVEVTPSGPSSRGHAFSVSFR
jgi:hypothetical protein